MADGKRNWPRFGGIFLAALLSVSSLPAQPAVIPGVPEDDAPLFNRLDINPQTYTVLAVGGAAGPGLPSLQVLSVLYGGEHPQLRVWSLEGPMSSRNGRARVATATMLPLLATPGMRGITGLALCAIGDHLESWTLINTDEVRTIPRSVLEWITDEKPISVGTLDVDAYVEFLVEAARTPNKAFVAAAVTDLTYWHLFNEPAKYRGRVVRFEGRLKRIRRFDPPEEALVRGVRNLYEGWMFDPEIWGANPICIVFTDLPPGLKVGEKADQHVSFAGYFFKKYRYKARDSQGNFRRDAPMLIGHTVTVLDQGPAPQLEAVPDGWARDLMPIFLGTIALTLVTVVVLTLWFRRTDSKVHQRLAAARGDGGFVPPSAIESTRDEGLDLPRME